MGLGLSAPAGVVSQVVWAWIRLSVLLFPAGVGTAVGSRQSPGGVALGRAGLGWASIALLLLASCC